jgi:hypothetical protein
MDAGIGPLESTLARARRLTLMGRDDNHARRQINRS